MAHNCYDKYWRLKDHSNLPKSQLINKVTAVGYTNVNMISDRGTLLKYIKRSERGLLCYEKCSNDELRTFATQRNISFDVMSELKSRATLTIRDMTIQRLMEEDKKLRFTGLFDLPPELRNRIYTYYDTHFERSPVNPTKPPLAQTCRQLRQEVSPIFFSKHEFEIKVKRALKDAPTPRGKTPVFHEDRDTEYFLSTLTEADAANIHSLKLVICDVYANSDGASKYGTAATILISLESFRRYKLLTRQFPSEAGKGKVLTDWTTKHLHRLRRQLRERMSIVQSREGGSRFKLQDLHDFRKAVSAAYR